MGKYKYIGIVLLLLFSAGCEHSPVSMPKDFGFDYIPLQVGNWIEYDVDSIALNSFTERADTFSFIMRDEVVETFEDLEGRAVFRVERRYSNADTSNLFRKNYALILSGVRLELIDENLRTIPLVFPPKNGEDWSGNTMNALDESSYSYAYVDRSKSINELNFDRSLRVIQIEDTTNLIIKRFSEEQYAREVGLIYKEYFDIETQFGIDSGLHWIQQIRDYHIQ